ncbi:glycerol kinase [Cephaloticoccus primus]|uniref:Glycerol kinase n=1 Tax=Cephaloticoccus primus TaxID=1548207 RepID=A0A139SUH2_9BACT|nr:glycerol kinase GlpK [Cephaloticoccus primus]KXU38207.1 glycerol kinase [Cephaloticoccus primus]
MSDSLILALDQGTTSSRAILFDRCGAIRHMAQRDFRQIFPQPGWVEHDPRDIWESQLAAARAVIAEAADAPTPAAARAATSGELARATGKGLTAEAPKIAAVGITNQRETTLVWDRRTGEPIYNAIVWQDRRTAEYCDALRAAGHAAMIREKTGLVLDAYFSATKLRWILDSVPGARARAEAGELCFGTVDTWLLWKLTEPQHPSAGAAVLSVEARKHGAPAAATRFITDVSNASRTLLFNIHTLDWDEELLALFSIPRACLPGLRGNSEVYGHTAAGLFPGPPIPIAGMAGDQHAALFGQMCLRPGMMKNTYGTGCFLMMNTGGVPVTSRNQLLTTVAWRLGSEVTYALEGSVFVAGAAIQWLRDGLRLIESAPEVNALAASVEDSGGVVFVPALTGLGAPHWDGHARGTLLGLTRGTSAAHIARATLEGIACQVCDIVRAMQADAGTVCAELRVDGGASASDLLMQIQSDLLGLKILRPQTRETTAFGAAYLAGLAVGHWSSVSEIQTQWHIDREFSPQLPREAAARLTQTWARAVDRAKAWAAGA